MARSQSTIDRKNYEEAKAHLLGDIVPAEAPPSCCLVRCFKCCLFYSFCCCCCATSEKQNTKANFMRRFTKWASNKKQNDDLSVVKILMRLYAHQPSAIESLETLARINPDFQSPFRNDLEFYISQLCVFLLRGDLGYVEHDQLLNLILVAS